MGLKKINTKEETSQDYAELYNRNFPIISPNIQNQVKDFRIAVAGCGSTGGAFIDGALRLGIQSFHLCDNGEYELTNLNRQMVFVSDIGKNKSEVYFNKIKNVNKNAKVQFWPEGLTTQNIDVFLTDIDFLFDAVDVTTSEGMKMKLLLHEKAAERKLPTGTALDLGFTQWIKSYNYQDGESALHGQLQKARAIENPLKAVLAGFISIDELPLEITEEIIRLFKNTGSSACQLASACFLLSSLVTPYFMSYFRNKKLPPVISVDILSYFENDSDAVLRKKNAIDSRRQLLEMLEKVK